MRKTVLVRTTQSRTKSAIAPRSGRNRRRASRRRPTARPAVRVQLDERARGRRLDEPEPEERERRADDDGEERPRAGPLARDGSESVDHAEQEPLHAAS